MSQSDLVIEGGTSPGSPSRTDVRLDIQAGLQAVGSNQKGPGAPPGALVGSWWLEDDNPSSTVWTLWLRVTSTWAKVATVDSTTGVVTPVGVASGVAPGVGAQFWGTTAPTGWLFVYGQAVSRTTYADLYAAIGTTYGVGDGSTTFNLPDMRERLPIGRGTMGGGPSPGRVTTAGGGIDGSTLGAVGGAQSVTLDTTNMPPHIHSAPGVSTDSTGTGGFADAAVRGADPVGGTIGGGNTSSAGGTAGAAVPFSRLPPGIVCNYIIKT